MDTVSDYLVSQPPTQARPLLGLTVLVVEDSRFACEAMRMLCLRSGARIRRADSLRSARKHLMAYRPSVVIVDLGLPDGSGADLIGDLTKSQPPIDVILGTSGDTALADSAFAAGAKGFIEKPIASLSAFQNAILEHLPAERHPKGPRIVTDETIEPDVLAYQDDMAHIADILTCETDDNTLDYIAQFLSGVALSAKDKPLKKAADDFAVARAQGSPVTANIARIAGLVQERIETPIAI